MKRYLYPALFALMVALILVTAGCASAPAVSTVTAVPVVKECPVPSLPAKPDLPIGELKAGAPVEVTTAAYGESLNVCIKRVQALEALFEGYRHD